MIFILIFLKEVQQISGKKKGKKMGRIVGAVVVA